LEAAREEVDRILDPADRDRRAAKLRQETDDEIQQMAKRLTELIPTDGCLAKPGRIELYDAINFKRISPNEYVMEQSPPADTSQALLNMLAGKHNKTSTAAAYEIDYLNPMGNTTNSTGDDEFIEEWYNQHFLLQQQGRNSSSADENEDDQEDVVETFLV